VRKSAVRSRARAGAAARPPWVATSYASRSFLVSATPSDSALSARAVPRPGSRGYLRARRSAAAVSSSPVRRAGAVNVGGNDRIARWLAHRGSSVEASITRGRRRSPRVAERDAATPARMPPGSGEERHRQAPGAPIGRIAPPVTRLGRSARHRGRRAIRRARAGRRAGRHLASATTEVEVGDDGRPPLVGRVGDRFVEPGVAAAEQDDVAAPLAAVAPGGATTSAGRELDPFAEPADVGFTPTSVPSATPWLGPAPP
jgi:hypothetical protein